MSEGFEQFTETVLMVAIYGQDEIPDTVEGRSVMKHVFACLDCDWRVECSDREAAAMSARGHEMSPWGHGGSEK